MTAEELPEVRFDMSRAFRIFPRPVAKQAVQVRIPRTDDGSEIPAFIKPEWGGVQVFYGDYYGIIGTLDGRACIVYGSAREQWENMHSELRPGSGWWIKTAVPVAYQADGPCRIVTLIPSDDGGIRETSYVLQVGDYIVCQPGGEVQHVKAAKFGAIYFLPEEAASLGLDELSADQFAEWAMQDISV